MSRESEDERGVLSPWQPCPSGEFGRLSKRLGQRHQRRRFLRASVAAAAMLASIGGLSAYIARTRPAPPAPPRPNVDVANIECSQVHQVAADYLRGDLDEETRRRVKAHISRCAECNHFLNAMRSDP